MAFINDLQAQAHNTSWLAIGGGNEPRNDHLDHATCTQTTAEKAYDIAPRDAGQFAPIVRVDDVAE